MISAVHHELYRLSRVRAYWVSATLQPTKIDITELEPAAAARSGALWVFRSKQPGPDD